MTFRPALRGENRGWDSAAMADWKEPARSVSRNAAPTTAYYLARRLGKVRGEAAELRRAWTSFARACVGCGARRSRRRQWRRTAAGAVVAAESENGVVAPAEWGQDGASKVSEGFG